MLSQGETAGFEAWVEGKEDKKRLNEYQIVHHPAQGNEPAYTECFLETIDEPIRIRLTRPSVDPQRHDFQVSVYVDGNTLSAKAWLKADSNMSWDNVLQEQEGQINSSCLRFTPLPTTDDPNKVTIDPISMKELGTIEITTEKGDYLQAGLQEERVYNLNKVGTIHEDVKKLPYSVTTSESSAYQREKTMHYHFYPKRTGQLFHKFIFRYRPRPVLVQMRIIDEPGELSIPAQPRLNNKRRFQTLEEVIEIKDEAEEGDVKPGLSAKRVKYLEDQIKRLSSDLKQARKGEKAEDDIVDLTKDEDE